MRSARKKTKKRSNSGSRVNVPPAIATQPVSLGAGAGTGVVFSVTATGTAPLSYQWSKDGSPLSGATLATLSLANVSSATAGT